MSDITIQSGLKSILGPGITDDAKGQALKLAEGQKSFGEVLSDSLREVNQLQIDADKAIEDFATGQTKNVHETMLALNKADTAFKMTMQVKNKIVEAYQEIIRMQV